MEHIGLLNGQIKQLQLRAKLKLAIIFIEEVVVVLPLGWLLIAIFQHIIMDLGIVYFLLAEESQALPLIMVVLLLMLKKLLVVLQLHIMMMALVASKSKFLLILIVALTGSITVMEKALAF